jgi:hypothetical protein
MLTLTNTHVHTHVHHHQLTRKAHNPSLYRPAPRCCRGTLGDAVRRARLFHQPLEDGSIGVDLASVIDVSIPLPAACMPALRAAVRAGPAHGIRAGLRFVILLQPPAAVVRGAAGPGAMAPQQLSPSSL